MLQTILVATDGSDHAHKAVVFAADLALKYGASLVIVHVPFHGWLPEAVQTRLAAFEPAIAKVKPMPDIVGDAVIPGDLSAADRRLVSDTILGEAKITAESKGCHKVETVLEEGDPATVILRRAKAVDADLIVLGSRGLGALKGLLLGSISHKVAQLAECTCVAVK